MSVAGIPFALIDQPTKAMKTAIAKPKSWWLVAVLLLLSVGALAIISAPYSAEMTNEASERVIASVTAQMSEEQAQQVLAQVKPQQPRRLAIAGTLAGLAAMMLGWVVRAAIYHFSSMAMGGQSVWATTFAVTAWSSLPFFFPDLLQTAYVVLRDQLVPHQGLGILVGTGDVLANAQNVAYVALSQIEPFALWHLVLLTIGLSVAIKLSKTQAALLAIVVWAVFVGLSLLPVAIGASLTSSLLG